MDRLQKKAFVLIQSLNDKLDREWALAPDYKPTYSIIVAADDFCVISYSIPHQFNPIVLQLFNSFDNEWDEEKISLESFLANSLGEQANLIMECS